MKKPDKARGLRRQRKRTRKNLKRKCKAQAAHRAKVKV